MYLVSLITMKIITMVINDAVVCNDDITTITTISEDLQINKKISHKTPYPRAT